MELDAVAPDFTPALDVPNGGLLCALPALAAVGLLQGMERHLQMPKGYDGIVNPEYRHLDGPVRSATGKLTRRLAKFAAMTLEKPIEPKHVEPFVRNAT